ncbi:hypothetical protein [Nitrosomonas communis]|nr:hypothetical protein [Nitrosomonas communis]
MAYLLLSPEKHRLSIYHREMIDTGASIATAPEAKKLALSAARLRVIFN